MASKEATAPAAEAKKQAAAPTAQFFAFELTLPKEKIGEKTTNPQVKSKVGEAFMGYGAFSECQVLGGVGADRTVIVFFARLFGKGQPAWEALNKNEKVTVPLYDEQVELRLSGAKPSGGGATTNTSSRPKKETSKKPGGRGRGAPKEGEDKKEDSKDGGRGRGRPKRDDEPKKDASLQRGRANIGGKLGQPSKLQLAKAKKRAFDAENVARVARGEEPLPEEKKKGRHDEEDDSGLPPKKDAKKEAGKKDAGKKEGGKKEAGKAEAKKEGAKKGK